MSLPAPSVAAAAPERHLELESVRGLAALLVVIYHMPHWYPPFFTGVIANGYLMVELFFVLSGFVIASAYSQRIHSVRDLLKFQFLRLARLYPVHLLFLLVFLGFEAAKYMASVRWGMQMPNFQPFKENSWEAFGYHLVLLHGVLPKALQATFNGPSWSISVEFYTYFLFALVTLLSGRLRIFGYAIFALGALWALTQEVAPLYSYTLRCLSGFFLGVLVSELIAAFPNIRLPKGAAFFAVLFILIFLGFKPHGWGDWLIFFMSAFLIVALTKTSDDWFKKLFRSSALLWLGTVSYSVYMSHYSIAWIANQVVRVLLKRPDVYFEGRFAPSLGPWETMAAYVIVIGVVLILSSVVYKRIELPVRQWSRQYANKW